MALGDACTRLAVGAGRRHGLVDCVLRYEGHALK